MQDHFHKVTCAHTNHSNSCYSQLKVRIDWKPLILLKEKSILSQQSKLNLSLRFVIRFIKINVYSMIVMKKRSLFNIQILKTISFKNYRS